MSKETRLAKKNAKKIAKELKNHQKLGLEETTCFETKEVKNPKNINKTISSF